MTPSWNDAPRAERLAFRLAKIGALVALLLSLATAAQAGPLELVWDRSPDPTVIGYVVLYGIAPGTYTGTLDVGNQTSATVRGLAEGQTYYFAVQAYSASDRLSIFSNVVSGTAANQPPHITTPGPQSGAEGGDVTLALAGSDADADPLTYAATGLPSGLNLDTGTGVISGTLAFDAAGTHDVTVTVSDGPASSSATFPWVIANTEQAPVVIVPDLSHGVGAQISYAIPATEPDGTLMTFSATTALPPGLALNQNSGLITGTLTAAGIYPVTLVVTDEGLMSTTAHFQWTVLASNAAPTLEAPGDQEGTLVNPASLQLAASDPDGNTLTYSATGLPPGLVLDTRSGAIAGQPTLGGAFPVTVSVSDGLASPSRTFTWTILANRPPTIESIPNTSSLVFGSVSFDVQATDPDNSGLTFIAVSLPSGLVIDANTGSITGAPTQVGVNMVTIFVSDGALSANRTFSWTILANRAPTLQNPGAQSSEEYRSLPPFTVSSSDPDGNPLTFAAVGLPPGLWIDTESGTVAGLPTLVGSYTVTITVSDGAASASQTFTWVIFPNPPPTIENPGAQSGAVVGTPVFLPITAGDPNGHGFTLTASGLPPGLALDETLMMVLGTPTTAGTYSDARLTAFDGAQFTSVSFTWTVAASPGPFTFVQANHAAPGGTLLSVTVPYNMAPQRAGSLNVVAIGWHDATATITSVTDTVGNAYVLAVGPTVLPGVATQSLYYAANIGAAGAGGNAVQVIFTTPATTPDVRIAEYAGVRAVAPLTGTAAAQGSGVLSDSGPLTTTRSTELLVAANLVDAGTTTAAGASFVARVLSSQGSLLEDRTVTALGSYHATAPIAPNAAWIMQMVAFRAVNTPPSLGPVSNQSYLENAFVTEWLAAIDPDGDPLTYDVSNLPDGLGINNDTGLIAGLLTFGSAGVRTATAMVSDGEFTTERTFTWTVTNVNRAPLLTPLGDRTDAEHASISLALVASDPDGDALTFSATDLPDGVMIHPTTGVISGTLSYTSAGRHVVTATVSDGSLTHSQTFVWIVMNHSTRGDFDGDGKTDVTVFRPSTGTWSILKSGMNSAVWNYQWGTSGDLPVLGDYDGDGRTDLTVFRPSTGTWYILQSSTNFTAWSIYRWGISGDIPVAGDYDGDGRADVAVFRPSTGTWYILRSSTDFTAWSVLQWGTSGDIPVSGDYDGDGRTDLTVFRPSTGTWYILQSSTNFTAWSVLQWGTSGDIPIPGDYDGDGKTDLAVFRPSTGTWYVLTSSTNFTAWSIHQWGTSGDIPIPGDYDGDGKTDMTVYRPSTGIWFISESSTNSTTWDLYQLGISGDIPVFQAR